MVRNSEKKTTRKIRKNRQTRRKRVLKMKTKMRKNRMHKTMKGGAFIMLTTLREQLKSTGDLGKQLNLHLNENAKYIAEKCKKGNKFIQYYNEALKLTSPASTSGPKQAWMEIVPAAGSEPMIQFIPDTVRDIPASIEFLITKIKEDYRELCHSSIQCGDRHHLYTLTPDEFDRVLRDVCSGQVHQDSCLRASCSNVMFKNDDTYVKLKFSLSNIVKKPNPSPDNFNTTFGPITSSSEGRNLDFTIILNKDNPDRVFVSVFQIYVELYNFLNETLLNPNLINCKACIIVMPPFKKAPPPPPIMGGHGAIIPSPVKFGYSSFTNIPLFKWKDLVRDERLEPNSYCALRRYKREIEPDSTLNYTMSPLVIPSDLLPPQSLNYYNIQDHHLSLLETMKQILKMKLNPQPPNDDLIEKKAKLKSDFETNGKVEMTHIYDQDGYYYYYELKIQKTTIPVKNTDNSDTSIEAVIIEFKVFSEDGICSKEIIFVSYKLHSSPADAFSVLPGYISDNTGYQVRPETMNRAILTLFDEKFLKLQRSLYQVELANSVLDLTDDEGNSVSRTNLKEISAKPKPLQLGVTASEGSTSDSICTIILTKKDSNFSWSIATATDIQKGAFTDVNKHITTKEGWSLERGQTIFPVDNKKTGPEEIKVNVRVLTVDKEASNQLISATYQAQDSVPYLLFANVTEAQNYINSKMMI